MTGLLIPVGYEEQRYIGRCRCIGHFGHQCIISDIGVIYADVPMFRAASSSLFDLHLNAEMIEIKSMYTKYPAEGDIQSEKCE